MTSDLPTDLAPLFAAVAGVMRQNRADLNQADAHNDNHGEHMLQIFDEVFRVFQENPHANPAESMQRAAQSLAQVADNGSAQEYARGFTALGAQLGKIECSQAELLGYLWTVVNDDKRAERAVKPEKSGEILKALIAGLSSWQRSATSPDQPDSSPDLGYMFDLGIAYLKAKQRNPDRLEALAEAAIAVCPLSQVPHRARSGKLAILALLQALEDRA